MTRNIRTDAPTRDDVTINQSGVLHIDRTPETVTHARRCPEYQVEYGVVDLDAGFPAEAKTWTDEYPPLPDDADPEEYGVTDDAHGRTRVPDNIQHFHVVSFPLVIDGFHSRDAAEAWIDSETDDDDRREPRFRVVQTTDTRGW